MIPAVSFVIPAYNCIQTIDFCLNSIFKQKFSENFEVLVIDNNSKDGSYEWLKNKSKNNSIILHREEKQGACFARNKGIFMAKAPLIAFVDSDVTLTSNWLQDLYDELKNYNLDGIQGKVIRDTLEANDKLSFLDAFRQEDAMVQTAKTNISLINGNGEVGARINTAACIYTRKILLRVGGFYPYQFQEDFDLSMRVSCINGKLGATTAVAAHVYYTGNLAHYLLKKFKLGEWKCYITRDWGLVTKKTIRFNLSSYSFKSSLIRLLVVISYHLGRSYGLFRLKSQDSIATIKILALLSPDFTQRPIITIDGVDCDSGARVTIMRSAMLTFLKQKNVH